MSLKIKILTVIVVGILGVFFLCNLIVVNNLVELIQKQEIEEYNMIKNIIHSKMEQEIKYTKAVVLTAINNQEIQRLFAKRDREGLLKLLSPVYSSVADRFSQSQFHLPDSTSFLRLHKPGKYGDSLKGFRFTVNVCNKEKKIVQGLEKGKAGYGIRVVAPVFYNGEHVGSFEYGADFGLEFLKSLKKELNGEYIIYTIDDRNIPWKEKKASKEGIVAATVAEDKWEVSVDSLKRVSQGQMVIKHLVNSHDVILVPFNDFSGKVSGYFKIIKDRSDIEQGIQTIKNNMYTLSLVQSVVSILMVYLLIQKLIIKPLANMSEDLAEEVKKYRF